MTNESWSVHVKQSRLEEMYDTFRQRAEATDKEIAIRLARFAEAHIISAANSRIDELANDLAKRKEQDKMAILTYTSSERPVSYAIDLPPCCGQTPEVVTWRRKKLVGIYCRNEKCANHPNGVLCYDDRGDIERRWEEFRNKG